MKWMVCLRCPCLFLVLHPTSSRGPCGHPMGNVTISCQTHYSRLLINGWDCFRSTIQISYFSAAVDTEIWLLPHCSSYYTSEAQFCIGTCTHLICELIYGDHHVKWIWVSYSSRFPVIFNNLWEGGVKKNAENALEWNGCNCNKAQA